MMAVQALTYNKMNNMNALHWCQVKKRSMPGILTSGHIERSDILSMPVQALTYNKMAPMALGRIDIKYRRIACQVPQNLDVIVDQNRGAGGWIRLQVKASVLLPCLRPRYIYICVGLTALWDCCST